MQKNKIAASRNGRLIMNFRKVYPETEGKNVEAKVEKELKIPYIINQFNKI